MIGIQEVSNQYEEAIKKLEKEKGRSLQYLTNNDKSEINNLLVDIKYIETMASIYAGVYFTRGNYYIQKCVENCCQTYAKNFKKYDPFFRNVFKLDEKIFFNLQGCGEKCIKGPANENQKYCHNKDFCNMLPGQKPPTEVFTEDRYEGELEIYILMKAASDTVIKHFGWVMPQDVLEKMKRLESKYNPQNVNVFVEPSALLFIVVFLSV